MSIMKTYVENVSIGLGYSGEINQHVTTVAQIMIDNNVPIENAEKSAKSWAGHPDCAPHPTEPIDLKRVKVRNRGSRGFDLVVADTPNSSILRSSLVDQLLADRVQAAIDNCEEPVTEECRQAGTDKTDARTMTFKTVDGPKTYAAGEMDFRFQCGTACVSQRDCTYHEVAESRADFVRKLHDIYCTEPGDETVGAIRKAVNSLPPDTEDELTVSISGNGCCIVGAGERILAHTNQYNGSPLAAIASLTKPEPTKGEVCLEIDEAIDQLETPGHWPVKEEISAVLSRAKAILESTE